MATQNAASTTTSKDIVITRVFDAPRELVWKAWTEPERLMKWWGPAEYTAPVIRTELRVGGKYHWCMRSPEGQDYWSTGVFREIVPPERLVMTDSFADEHGNVISPTQHGMSGDWPAELLITVTLEAQGGKTKLTMRQQGIPAGEMTDMTTAGWNGSFDKLAASLK